MRAYDFGTQRYLRTFHVGPYMQVGKTYKRLMAHASDQGLALADHSIEHYIGDPTKVDKTQLRTGVMIPLRCLTESRPTQDHANSSDPSHLQDPAKDKSLE